VNQHLLLGDRFSRFFNHVVCLHRDVGEFVPSATNEDSRHVFLRCCDDTQGAFKVLLLDYHGVALTKRDKHSNLSGKGMLGLIESSEDGVWRRRGVKVPVVVELLALRRKGEFTNDVFEPDRVAKHTRASGLSRGS